MSEVFYSVSYPENKIYQKVFTNLNPNSIYEICANGLRSDNFTFEDIGDCKKIKTQEKQSEVALIAINHDVEASALPLIDNWISAVESKNPNLQLVKLNIKKDDSAIELLNNFKNKYDHSNLRYIVLIGYELPALQFQSDNNSTSWLGLYSSLSNIQRGNWSNENNSNANEVTIAAIKPQETLISEYLERLLRFYGGEQVFQEKILLADAMIDSEKGLVTSDFTNFDLEVETVTGITSYSNISEANQWLDNYTTKLNENSYKLLFINAHGATNYHYPCGNNCIDYNTVRKINPNIQLTIAISCNIGNIMTYGAPMLSYVLDSGSISGLAAEVLFTDVNGSAAKKIMSRLDERKLSIGEAGRSMGFLVVGDPFVKLIQN